MGNSLKAEIDKITADVRRDPAHIRRWQEKEEELKKSPDRFLRHRRFFTEDFVFEPGEDIMVYPDFNYPLPKPKPTDPPEFYEPVLHRHEFFEMFYVYSGVCECIYEDQIYTLKPGSLCVFNTLCHHRVHNIGSESLIYNIMLRSKAFLTDLAPVLGENDLFFDFFLQSFGGGADRPNLMLFDLKPGGSAEAYVFGLIREYRLGRANSQSMMKLMYASLLIELSRMYMSTGESGGDFAGIMAYISKNWSRVTVKELTSAFHMSQSGLSRLFKERTGSDFSDYIRRFRMERAARMLARPELTVEKIAELCGYSQRASFDKEFKKHTGLTPCQYRKNPSPSFFRRAQFFAPDANPAG